MIGNQTEMNNVRIENGVITIKIDGVEHRLPYKEARALSNQLIAALREKEDYLSLNSGDVVFFVNKDEGIIEKGIIYSIHIKADKVDYFSVDFPESSDFDEFDGETLGDCFFIEKGRAEDALKCN